MRRLRAIWRDLRIVVRAVSGNLALFAALLVGAAVLIIHFFSPYERAADALVEHLRNPQH